MRDIFFLELYLTFSFHLTKMLLEVDAMETKSIIIVLVSLVIVFGASDLFSQDIEKVQMDEYNEILRLIVKENYEPAIERLKKLIATHPDFYRSYAALYKVYAMKNEVASAITFFDNLIRQDKGNSYAYYSRGYARKRAKTNDAIENFKLAIKFNPGLNAAYFGLVDCHIIKRTKESLEDCERYLSGLLKEYPTNPAPYCAMGYLYFYRYRFEEALSMLNRSIKLDPGFSRLTFSKDESSFIPVISKMPLKAGRLNWDWLAKWVI
jgi:tetratricopeptide (TPR) repeat protein